MASNLDPRAAVDAVYALLARRDLGSLLPASTLAADALAQAQGAERLALQEAIVHALSTLLKDMGEHGAQNSGLWGIEPSDVNVAALSARCAAAWEDARRLRASGLATQALVTPHVGRWMDPIGSRDWLAKMRLGVPHRSDPAWVAHVAERLRDEG